MSREQQQKVPPCGFPGCTDRHANVRLQLIPAGFSGDVFEGATCFHRKRVECAAHFGFGDSNKRQAGQSRIPVGAVVSEEPCPPIINKIDEIWGVRTARTRRRRTSSCAAQLPALESPEV